MRKNSKLLKIIKIGVKAKILDALLFLPLEAKAPEQIPILKKQYKIEYLEKKQDSTDYQYATYFKSSTEQN
jgi:hypothetical protein